MSEPASDDPQQLFLWQLRQLVRDEVRATLASIQQATRNTELLVSRVNNLGNLVATLTVDHNRLASWASSKALRDDMLDKKLDQFFELITPVTKPNPQ